jgi:hypothetical protein
MVYADMVLDTIKYDDPIEVVPVNFRKLKKTVPLNGGWEERTFYEVRPKINATLDWLTKHYGVFKYQETWWYTNNSIVMRDNIYTHWKLCE